MTYLDRLETIKSDLDNQIAIEPIAWEYLTDPRSKLEETLSPAGGVSLRGQISSTATVTGDLTITKPLAGSIVCTSAVNGDFQIFRYLDGSIGSTATVTGALSVTKPLSGTINATSTVAGDLTIGSDLRGAINCVATVTGDLTITKSLTGSIAATSSITGTLTNAFYLAGSINCTTTIDGALSLTKRLVGAIVGSSTVTGDLTVNGSLSGAIVCTSTVAGALSVTKPLSGAIAATSTVAGDLTVTPAGLTDTFTDPTNTLITSHTANSGQSYSVAAFGPGINSSKWIILSNVLLFQSNANGGASSIATAETNLADFRFTATLAIQIPTSANCQIGVVFRYVDVNNFWRVRYDENNTRYELSKFVAGVETSYATYSYTASTAFETHFIQIDAVGSSIVVAIDGTQRLTATSTDLSTATKAGYYGYIDSLSSDAGYVDSVTITRPVKDLAGSIASNSTVTGALSVTKSLAGAITATSTVSDSLAGTTPTNRWVTNTGGYWVTNSGGIWVTS